MERTRSNIYQQRSALRETGLYIGGLAWHGSRLISILISSGVALALWQDQALGLGSLVADQVFDRSETLGGEVTISPTTSAASLARWVLMLQALSSWWNPSLLDRVRRPGGRVYNLSEFYVLQAISLAVQSTALYCATGISASVDTHRAAHLCLAILITFVSNPHDLLSERDAD